MAKSRSRKGSKKGSCGPGKIRRVSYSRKSYTRASGKRVKGSKVSSACVKDMGKPGKTKKSARVLPKFKGDMHLSNYGYGVDRSADKRREALRNAVKAHGALLVLRHLNLARNYQAVPKNKEIMGSDVEYLSKLHKRSKRVSSKKGSRSRKGSKRRASRSKSRSRSKGSRKGSKRRSRK